MKSLFWPSVKALSACKGQGKLPKDRLQVLRQGSQYSLNVSLTDGPKRLFIFPIHLVAAVRVHQPDRLCRYPDG